jgi:hypothetical protein
MGNASAHFTLLPSAFASGWPSRRPGKPNDHWAPKHLNAQDYQHLHRGIGPLRDTSTGRQRDAVLPFDEDRSLWETLQLLVAPGMFSPIKAGRRAPGARAAMPSRPRRNKGNAPGSGTASVTTVSDTDLIRVP